MKNGAPEVFVGGELTLMMEEMKGRGCSRKGPK